MDFQLTNDDDEIIGTDQIDRVTIRGVGGTDWLDLRGGNDLVDGESERATLLAGAGNDFVRYQIRSSLASAFRGGDGDDHFIITDIGGPLGRVTVEGEAGNDTIDLFGTSGRFRASGGDGNDVLNGSAVRDTLIGGAGRDTLSGGAGDDVLAPNADRGGRPAIDADIVNGGDGNDTVTYENARFPSDSQGFVIVDLADSSRNGGGATSDVLTSIENVTGTRGADVIYGTDGVNVLTGAGGLDVLYGRGGDDHLSGGMMEGGQGADRLTGGSAAYATYRTSSAGVIVDFRDISRNTGDAAGDTFIGRFYGVIGSDFDDELVGPGGDFFIRLEGGAGDDILTGGWYLVGGPGADVLRGSSKDFDVISWRDLSFGVTIDVAAGTSSDGDRFFDVELIYGSDFADEILGTADADKLYGFGGDDRIVGDAGHDYLRGGAGADQVNGGAGDDTVIGEAGDDVLDGGAGADILNGGSGFDVMSYASATAGLLMDLNDARLNTGDAVGDRYLSIESLRGSAFADDLRGDAGWNTIEGGDGNDSIVGRGGNDTVHGDAGDDVISGDAGDDSLDGGSGRDTLNGGADADTLSGRGGDDRLFGDDGDDLLVGSVGSDLLNGGAGIDTVSYAGVRDVRVDLLSGETNQDDTLVSIENIIGYLGNDDLRGNNLANRIDGGSGRDVLSGRGGDDVLVGGTGPDRMTGGEGADRFVLSAGRFAPDTVMDFRNGLDRFVLTGHADGFSDLSFTAVDADGDGSADDLRVDFGTGLFIARNTNLAQIDAADFIF